MENLAYYSNDKCSVFFAGVLHVYGITLLGN